MKCPILEIGWMQVKVGDKGVSSDCLKEECTWWDKELGRCDPTGLIRPLIRLVQALEEIKDKMPHAGQFLK